MSHAIGRGGINNLHNPNENSEWEMKKAKQRAYAEELEHQLRYQGKPPQMLSTEESIRHRDSQYRRKEVQFDSELEAPRKVLPPDTSRGRGGKGIERVRDDRDGGRRGDRGESDDYEYRYQDRSRDGGRSREGKDDRDGGRRDRGYRRGSGAGSSDDDAGHQRPRRQRM
jgi:hypothetical protein